MLDPHTLDDSEAAVALAHELNIANSKKLTNKVCRFASEFSFHLNQLEKTAHQTKTYCARLLYEQYIEAITDHCEWAGNVRSLLKTVIHSLYMKHLGAGEIKWKT